jgi:hypothetical protein
LYRSLKGGLWQIEKRCKHAEGGWLGESTGTSSRTEAEDVLIRRLAELRDIAQRKAQRVFTFEEAALRYLDDIAHKPSAGTAAFQIDQVLSFIGDKVLAQVHDGTVKPFVDHELARGAAPKSINNALGVVSAVLNRAGPRGAGGPMTVRRGSGRHRLAWSGCRWPAGRHSPTRCPGMNWIGCCAVCAKTLRTRCCSPRTLVCAIRKCVRCAGTGR